MSKTKKAPAPMTLRKYIEDQRSGAFGRTNPTIIALAKKSGLAEETIYRVARGDYSLRNSNAVKLSKATGGAVQAATLAGL